MWSVCTPPPARGSQRDRVFVSLSPASLSIAPSAAFRLSLSLFLQRLVESHQHLRLLRPFDTTPPSPQRRAPLALIPPARSRCPSAFSFFYPLSFSFSLHLRLFLLAAAADAQPVLHQQIDSTLRTSRWSERAVLVHGFRNLLQLDRTSGAIVRRG